MKAGELIVVVWLSALQVNATGAGAELGCSFTKALRLVGGSSEAEGRLEVCGSNHRWSTVDRTSLIGSLPAIACSVMGHSLLNPTIHDNTTVFGEGSGNLTEFQCDPQAKNFFHCELRNSTSNHSRDAAMACQPRVCQDWDVRLVGGPSDMEGKVEVCEDEQWRAMLVETKRWTVNDAGVVCNQLGHSRFGAVVRNGSEFNGTRNVSKHLINCEGGETNIAQCSRNCSSVNGSRTQTVGVVCQQKCFLCRNSSTILGFPSTSSSSSSSSPAFHPQPTHTTPTCTQAATAPQEADANASPRFTADVAQATTTAAAAVSIAPTLAAGTDRAGLLLAVMATGAVLVVLLIVGVILCCVVIIRQRVSSIKRSERSVLTLTDKPQMQYSISQEPRSHDLGALPRTPCKQESPEYDQLEEYELMMQPQAKTAEGGTRKQRVVPTATNMAYEKMTRAAGRINPEALVSTGSAGPVGAAEEDQSRLGESEYEVIPYMCSD